MFKFSTTSFVNDLTYLNGEPSFFRVASGTITLADGTTKTTTNTTEKSFTVNRNIKLTQADVTKVTRTQFQNPSLATLTIDLTKLNLVATDTYRLYIYVQSIGDADPLYANDFIYKGRPFYLEFSGKDNTGEKFAKNAKKWIKLLYGNGDIFDVTYNDTEAANDDPATATVTFTAKDEYKRFHFAEIQKYNPNALVWAHDGAFETEVNSEDDSLGVFTIVKGKQGFGTYVQLTKDLRLPTNANNRQFRIWDNEMPVAGGKYWQYIITCCTERPEMQGTSVLGQYNKSITTHVVWVLDGATKTAFDSALTSFLSGSSVSIENGKKA